MAALTFPLSLAEFQDRLPIQDFSFSLASQTASTGLASGEILRAEIAPAMWRGEISLAPMRARVAAEVEALLALLEGPAGAFLACRPHQRGPAADPLGAALAGAAVVIDRLDADARLIALAGLPAGFALAPGDLLGFDYGSAPLRQALHRVTGAGVVADGLGVTPLFEVGPHIRPGALAGATVTLTRPACKAVLVPGSVNYGQHMGRNASGLAFAWRQSFR